MHKSEISQKDTGEEKAKEAAILILHFMKCVCIK